MNFMKIIGTDWFFVSLEMVLNKNHGLFKTLDMALLHLSWCSVNDKHAKVDFANLSTHLA